MEWEEYAEVPERAAHGTGELPVVTADEATSGYSREEGGGCNSGGVPEPSLSDQGIAAVAGRVAAGGRPRTTAVAV